MSLQRKYELTRYISILILNLNNLKTRRISIDIDILTLFSLNLKDYRINII